MGTQQATEWGTSSFGRMAQKLTPWLNWWGATPPLPPRFEEAWALRLPKIWPWNNWLLKTHQYTIIIPSIIQLCVVIQLGLISPQKRIYSSKLNQQAAIINHAIKSPNFWIKPPFSQMFPYFPTCSIDVPYFPWIFHRHSHIFPYFWWVHHFTIDPTACLGPSLEAAVVLAEYLDIRVGLRGSRIVNGSKFQ